MPNYTYTRFRNPYNGLAESVATSLVVDTRDCFDLTVSWRTISGATSRVTYQISNDHGFDSALSEHMWSNWTVFGTIGVGSGATTFDPPLGYRWARTIRQINPTSQTSLEIQIAKQYR